MAGPKVLVVDDEEALARMIVAAVKSLHPGYEVTEAHNGLEAWAIACAERPDIVVTDLDIPGIDGYDLCRRIKSHEATFHADVIAITGSLSPENMVRVRQCGASVCLDKPFRLSCLLEHIDACLAPTLRHQRRSPEASTGSHLPGKRDGNPVRDGHGESHSGRCGNLKGMAE